MNDKTKLSKDYFDILKCISTDPNISQKNLSTKLGFSIGKLNYSLKELVKKEFIEILNLNETNKLKSFSYRITSLGISAKNEFAENLVIENIEVLEKIISKTKKNNKTDLDLGNKIEKV